MKSSRTRLLPLFFEMGRMLKSEISRGGAALPSYLHLETLRFIQMREKQGLSSTMSDVSEYLKVARPSATALIQGLVRDDILVRQPDPHDRRVVRLILSRKGSLVLSDALEQRDRAFKQITASLSEHDCAELLRILTSITKHSE
jgi:DNA-binding MarR family transcriptional regulator